MPQEAFGFLSGPAVASREIVDSRASEGPFVRLQVVGTRNAGRTLLYVMAHVLSDQPLGIRGSTLILATPDTILHLHADSTLHRTGTVCNPACQSVESAAYPIREAELRALADADTAELVLAGNRRVVVARALPAHLAQIRAFVLRYLDRPGPST